MLFLFTRKAEKPSAVTVKGIQTAFKNRLVKGNLIGEHLARMAYLGRTYPIDRGDMLGTTSYEILSADIREFDDIQCKFVKLSIR